MKQKAYRILIQASGEPDRVLDFPSLMDAMRFVGKCLKHDRKASLEASWVVAELEGFACDVDGADATVH